jgi:crossover junction endodeoxyribonuclease RuvC
MVKIIGIDPSLSSTGWAIVEKQDQSFKYISSGVLKTKSDSEIVNRLALIKQSLDLILISHEIDFAIIEDGFVSINQASALKLSLARGVIISSLFDFFIKKNDFSDRLKIDLSSFVKTLTPTFVKKAITGSGKADKIQVDKMIRMIVQNIPEAVFKNNDESDAVAIAISLV